ncbi:VOC family protein [Rummeliibacillus stabekisii]|uniref:VOC family protein n=1 Tax=Rummeliibacillus stabekisii TaxID=241244 RepID=UPI00203C83EF|nr:VOC family protein [Rummeliibacillus stabekisii]MCM3317203.1 VOC family protein [Rummeliibacillus stabekisii]
MEKVTPFLMFQGGKAEEAMNYYTSIIEDSTIESIVRYGPGENGEEGTVMQASFSLKGQEFMCIDSAPVHNFDFTPSFSIFITCDSEDELTYLYENLLADGEALMPLDNYGFSKKFGWVNDKFGVSWQINLPND